MIKKAQNLFFSLFHYIIKKRFKKSQNFIFSLNNLKNDQKSSDFHFSLFY